MTLRFPQAKPALHLLVLAFALGVLAVGLFPAHEICAQTGSFQVPDPGPVEAMYRLRAADRPDGHPQFLVAGLVLAPILLALSVWWYRRQPASPEVGSPPVSAGEKWALAAVLALAAGFRFIGLGRVPLEHCEWENVEFLPLADVMFHGYEVLTNPPLLAVIQHFLYPMSTDPAWFRVPVALFGVGLVLALWRVGRTLSGPTVGLFAAGLAAVHAGLVIWSQGVRGFIPCAFFLVLALPHAHRLARGTYVRRDPVLFVLWSALALWSSYLGLFVLAVLGVVMVWGRRGSRRDLAILAGVSAWLLVCFLPLAPFAFSSLGVKQASGFNQDLLVHSLAFITGLPLWFGWIVPAAIALGFLRRVRSMAWLLGLGAGFLGVVVITDRALRWEIPYLVPVIPVVLLLLAMACRRIPRAGLVALVALLAVPTVVLRTAPLDRIEGLVAEGLDPYLLRRAVAHPLFVDRIRESLETDSARFDCDRMLVLPEYDFGSYLYHFGPLTSRDVGLEPFVERAGASVRVAPAPGGEKRSLQLAPIATEGFEPDTLRDLLADQGRQPGCFWLSVTDRYCDREISASGCGWLRDRCSLAASTWKDRLYHCPGGVRGSGAGVQ